MSKQKSHTAIVGGGTKDVAGIEVPPDIVAALGAGQRPRVSIEVNGYRYSSTIGKVGGKHLIPLSAEHRRVSSFSVCDDVEVHISVAGAEPVAIPHRT